jgi:hypothetical protein
MRKLQTQVNDIDEQVKYMDSKKLKKINFEYYTIKDIMSD